MKLSLKTNEMQVCCASMINLYEMKWDQSHYSTLSRFKNILKNTWVDVKKTPCSNIYVHIQLLTVQ